MGGNLEVSRLEKTRSRARFVGKLLFGIHGVAISASFLLCVLMISTIIRGEHSNNMIPTLNKEDENITTGMTCSSQLIIILALVSSAPQLLGVLFLLKGTNKDLKPEDAIKLVAIHTNLQYAFIFAELAILFLSNFFTGLYDLVEIIGYTQVVMVVFFQCICLLAVNLFEDELAAAVKNTTKEFEKTQAKGITV